MLNVLHGRFVANPAQNSPSHIMKGGRGVGVWVGERKHKCQQFHTGTGLDTPASPPRPRHPTTPPPAFSSSSALLLSTGQTRWTLPPPPPPLLSFTSLPCRAKLTRAHASNLASAVTSVNPPTPKPPPTNPVVLKCFSEGQSSVRRWLNLPPRGRHTFKVLGFSFFSFFFSSSSSLLLQVSCVSGNRVTVVGRAGGGEVWGGGGGVTVLVRVKPAEWGLREKQRGSMKRRN